MSHFWVGGGVQTSFKPKALVLEMFGIFRHDSQGSKVYPLLIMASAWALFNRSAQNNRHILIAFILAAVSIEILAYCGAAFNVLRGIQPNRFAPAGYLLLCLPAGCGLSFMLRALNDRGVRRTGAVAGFILAFSIGTILTWELWREVTPGSHGRFGSSPPQVKPLGDDTAWVIDFIKHYTASDARVLFETGMGRPHDHGHLAGYYAYQTKREFVGGPYPTMYFASFWDGSLFGKPIDEITYVQMAEYFKLYNIGQIIVFSDSAKRYFDGMKGVVHFYSEHEKLRAYTVDGDYSYFFRGSGRIVTRDHNHLVLTDIIGELVVLKYHYVPGLSTIPATQIEGVYMLNDPKPFVQIRNPPAHLVLSIP